MHAISMLRPVASASGASPKPALCPPPAPSCRYRRSVTTKAPRKRTFIANMTKYTELSVPASALDAGVAAPVMDICPMELCLDCGSGNGNNSGRNTGGNDRGDFGSSSNEGPFSFGLPFINLPLALAVATAVTISNMAFANGPSMALGISALDLSDATASIGTRSNSLSRAGSTTGFVKLDMVHVPAGTLNIPVTADGPQMYTASSSKGGRVLRKQLNDTADKIVYGRVCMTADEMKLFADKQYHVREMIRV